MSLARLDIQDFRNIEAAALRPDPGLNFIIGPNASGKTSLLEAIFVLGRGRSFRTSQIGPLIRLGQPALTVGGSLAGEGPALPVGIRLGRGAREIHLGGRPVLSSAVLLRSFPVVAIQPAATALLEGPPRQRRQFLDFGVFHLNHDYLDHWRRYSKALGQRNALLRENRLRDLPPWNHELARYGTIVEEARRHYAERLSPHFHDTGSRFFPGLEFELRLQPGWDPAKSLASILEDEAAADARQGYTQSGPHKGDFSIHLSGRAVRAYLSRGQTKLLVYALLLAQSRLLEDSGQDSCVLIDDVASELDNRNRGALLGYLRERRNQFFITATGREMIAQGLAGPAALFRMEEGRVAPA